MHGRIRMVAAAMALIGPGVSQAQDDVGRSADWTLAVRDPAQAEARIRTALRAHGGYVSDRQAAHTDLGDRITLGLRVSASSLDPFLEEVRGIGKALKEETRAQDPTPEYAKVNSRLAALEAAERDLREQMSFLAPDDPLAADLQREVAGVRSERMEVLARRTLLDDRVQYAVVRLTLVPESDSKPSLGEEVLAALASPWVDPAGAVRRALVVGLGLIVPYAGGFALLVFLGLRWARRRRRPGSRP